VCHHTVNTLFGVLNRVIASKGKAIFSGVHENKYKSGVLGQLEPCLIRNNRVFYLNNASI